MDAGMLRRIAHGDLGDVATKLAETLADLEQVTPEIDEASVWSIPQLLALTKQALGVTSQTSQDRAIEHKLLEIKTGKTCKSLRL